MKNWTEYLYIAYFNSFVLETIGIRIGSQLIIRMEMFQYPYILFNLTRNGIYFHARMKKDNKSGTAVSCGATVMMVFNKDVLR